MPVKKRLKMANFGLKLSVNAFGKMGIFRLFELLVFIGKKGVFFLEYRKRHLPGLCFLKKKFGRTANFGP